MESSSTDSSFNASVISFINSSVSSFINSSNSIDLSDSNHDQSLDSSTATSSNEFIESDGADESTDCPTSPVCNDAVDPLHQPLYDGADLTLWETYMLLMQHSVWHSLTRRAFGDLLKLVGMLLTSKSKVSYYKLQKYFLDLYGNVGFTKRYCCARCHSSLTTKEATCPSEYKSTPTEFLTMSVESQLTRNFEGEKFIL